MYGRATSNASTDKRIAGGINGCRGRPSENYVTVFERDICDDGPGDSDFPAYACGRGFARVPQPSVVRAHIKRDPVHVFEMAAWPHLHKALESVHELVAMGHQCKFGAFVQKEMAIQ